MEYRQLGNSGLKVPVLSFGAGTFGGKGEFFKAWGSTDILCAVFEGLAVVASFGLLSKSISRRPLSRLL